MGMTMDFKYDKEKKAFLLIVVSVGGSRIVFNLYIPENAFPGMVFAGYTVVPVVATISTLLKSNTCKE